MGLCGRRPFAVLGREDRDGEVQQQRQAEAQQCQGDESDARPQDVDAELVGHPGAHAEDHPAATILAKTLVHVFPFDPGRTAGVLGGLSGLVRRPAH